MVRTYLLLAWTWLRASAQYRAQFAMMILGSLAVNVLDVTAILLIFQHTETLAGFGLAEVMFLYGTTELAFAVSDMLFGNVTRLSEQIRTGGFDTMLIRPAGAFVQMAVDRFGVQRLGRVTQAIVVLAIALPQLDVPWSRAWMIPLMILCGIVIFTSIFTLGGALQFLLTDAPEVANAFTYGGSALTQYPLSVYGAELVRGVTFVVPLAFVNWQPALFVLDREDPFGLPHWLRFASPLAAVAIAAVAALAWRTGVRRYRSTGS
ncbi:ABC-2 type transport system permease protein [Streptosporangium becharense]|uniref:ABC-2 type transport system permease protein n=1 Tax=Streptosporangium becharense TaxID=1816182 RepID=A0A7W9ILM2_9ACTN|nr:ABC-2 family transporter protein [Streptosporangium becharense]MBB2910239.1 ABC-2 type transport system permease protein [Streptosporangium becharense]MBB5822982.1 ABC-2 type transport system permease protein [Streptosporangium becharense]